MDRRRRNRNWVCNIPPKKNIIAYRPSSNSLSPPQQNRIFLTTLSLSPPSPLPLQLHGFDISTAQFPISQWLPPNVTLHQQDAFTVWPEHWQGKFDMVALRFINTFVGSEERWERLMEGIVGREGKGGILSKFFFFFFGNFDF